MRHFNIAGPCDPDIHYMVPAESRLPDLSRYLEARSWFVLHAPRQSGKTTALRAWARRLTAQGQYAALYTSCEGARAVPDVETADVVVWGSLFEDACSDLPPELRPVPTGDAPPGQVVRTQLRLWAERCPRPIVLVLDEIDGLPPEPLGNLLGQLRSSYARRPSQFPSSIILCGMKDIRDYKVAAGGYTTVAGSASPFNVVAASLRLRDFSFAEVSDLYLQHVAATGQVITPEAITRAWELSQGQPWLVNAVMYQVLWELAVTDPVTAEHIDQACERLVRSRPTHLDSLLARLQEDRVRRVLEPILAGTLFTAPSFDNDFDDVCDLGLVAPELPPRIANPVYREIILRVLAVGAEASMPAVERSYLMPGGRLDMAALMAGFFDFWRQHAEALTPGMPYHEIAVHLVLMAWLHKVINGGGRIEREVGVGRGRVDVLLQWPVAGAWQREVVEIKVWRDKQTDPLAEGLVQIDGYLRGLGLDRGFLVLFDRRSTLGELADRIAVSEEITAGGRVVTVWRG